MGSDSFDKSDADRGVERSDAADAGREPTDQQRVEGGAGQVYSAPGADAAETEVVSVAKSRGAAGAGDAAPGVESVAAQHLAPWERQQGAVVDPWRQPSGAFGAVGAQPSQPSGAWAGQGQPPNAGLPPYPGTPGELAPGLGPQMQSAQYPGGPYAPASYQAAPAQMWMPPGRYLTQSTWRKRWKLPVIIGSSVVGLLMAAVTIFAVILGGITGSVFTARGVVMVSCQTSTAQDGLIRAGSELRIWAENGALEGTTRLDAVRSVKSKTGENVCYLPFEATKVSAGQSGFTVRVGSYTQFVTASALRSGVVLRPTQ
ncbi:hypothetical protein HH308_23800 [Gordonia sp. TBRC 11910]|uniref:Uncharacterized protein n=1 Tax=Gordonia asplenii TaxID=2725283 RepID=A0A848L1B3_9ACTN|nr:hypothetical protein [Gordonia asplenii]NMO04247.1 hypothetical protein [Gordonia asplenii]